MKRWFLGKLQEKLQSGTRPQVRITEINCKGNNIAYMVLLICSEERRSGLICVTHIRDILASVRMSIQTPIT